MATAWGLARCEAKYCPRPNRTNHLCLIAGAHTIEAGSARRAPSRTGSRFARAIYVSYGRSRIIMFQPSGEGSPARTAIVILTSSTATMSSCNSIGRWSGSPLASPGGTL